MGTSVSQGSAPSANWAAAQAGYRTAIPIDRVVQEIWRAATNQHEGDLGGLLRDPIVARIGQLASTGQTPAEIATAATKLIAQSKGASLAADIARRAAVQSALSQNPSQTYGQRVFAEATNYLVSRDLPGFVGGVNRNRSVSEAIAFKASILQSTIAAVRATGPPHLSSRQRWSRYVAAVMERLRSNAQ
jgi:hypothetical protein